MKYRYVALFAAAAAAAPLRDSADSASNVVAPRSREGLVGDVGVAAVVAGDGDATGVKNAKRGGVADDIGVGAVVLGDGDGTGVQNAKRFEVGDIDVGSTRIGRTDSGIPIIDPDL